MSLTDSGFQLFGISDETMKQKHAKAPHRLFLECIAFISLTDFLQFQIDSRVSRLHIMFINLPGCDKMRDSTKEVPGHYTNDIPIRQTPKKRRWAAVNEREVGSRRSIARAKKRWSKMQLSPLPFLAWWSTVQRFLSLWCVQQMYWGQQSLWRYLWGGAVLI